MAIAKVEPLTTARALRGPFDYRIPERHGGRRGRLGAGRAVRAPADPGPRRGRRPTERAAARAPGRAARALEAGVPPELVELGLWVAERVLLDPGAGARARAAARGPARAALPRCGPRRAARGRADRRQAARRCGRTAPRLGPRQHAALEALAGRPAGVSSAASWPRGAVDSRRAQEPRGARPRQSRRARRAAAGGRRWPRAGAPPQPPAAARPHAAQRGARGGRRALDGTATRELLLHGVTGSGKTEVYLRAAEAALEQGRSAIVLVPEIALTPQTVRALRGALRRPRRGAALEARRRASATTSGSACAAARRASASARARPSSPRVRDLGLIVVDEEHDAAYKQEGDPRYDARARRRAARRAARRGAAVPAAPRRGRRAGSRCRGSSCRDRVGRAARCRRSSCSTCAGSPRPLHPRTAGALDEVQAAGGKAIVLVNRRGWSPFLVCRSCGHAWSCPRCDVTLRSTADASRAALRLPPLRPRRAGARAHCPELRLDAIARHGAGTQRLEPSWPRRSRRCRSSGSTPTRRAQAAASPAILRRVRRGADRASWSGRRWSPRATTSRRSSSRRAGRRRHPPLPRLPRRGAHLRARLAARRPQRPRRRGGRVLVQTLGPTPPRPPCGRAHDAAGFLAGEIERRRALRYPPFSHLIRVELAAPEAAPARAGRGGSLTTPWPGSSARTPSSWAPRLAFGFGDGTGASSWSRPASARRRSPRSAPPSRAGAPRRCGRSRSRSTSSLSDAPRLVAMNERIDAATHSRADEPVSPRAPGRAAPSSTTRSASAERAALAEIRSSGTRC